MQRVACVTHPESLTALLAHALEEGDMNEQSEDRLFAEVREIDHMLRGNGGPGALSRIARVEESLIRMAEERKARDAEIVAEKTQAAEDRKNSFWRRLLFTSAGSLVAVLLATVVNVYLNRTPTITDKQLSVTEQQDRKRAEERLERIEEKLTKIVNPPPQPAPPVPPRRRSTRLPKRRAELRGNEMIAPSRSPTV